ncbi:hypothetical protein SO694_00128019 [Aureococcus anophagefferens]|uniref:Uncharacterized protein n=1 Tax=Aureococcus anophagefferens TaxID=44056 RepID=A0ABR1G516_AURAN|nr:hypothetical protein JL722_9157 [Aureococcus anophagefferens]
MPPLRRLGLPVELTAALARLAPPVLTLETLLERDVDALQRDTGFPRGAIVALRGGAAERRLGAAAAAAAAAAPRRGAARAGAGAASPRAP